MTGRQPDKHAMSHAYPPLAGRWVYRGRIVRIMSVSTTATKPMTVDYRYERTGDRGGMWRRTRTEPVQQMPVEEFRRLFRAVKDR